MAENEQSYTQRLSERIDAAFQAHQAHEDGADDHLYEAFKAQARNVVRYQRDLNDNTIEHDIAVRAVTKLKTFRGDCRASTWFYKIALNEAKRALRSQIRKREREVPLEESVGDGDEPETVDSVEIEAEPINYDARIDVERLRGVLPPKQDEVVRMQLEGHALEEIAAQQEEPIGTVRGRARLAKAKMERHALRKDQARVI